MKYLTSQPSRNSGFTLVEVLVAITILLLVITGPMRVIVRANNSTAYSSEQVTAFFLAQEGLELVQKGRDDLMLQQFNDAFGGSLTMINPWTTFKNNFAACIGGASTACGVSWNLATTPDSVAVTSGCGTAPATNCLLHTSTAATPTNRDRYTHTSSGSTKPTLFTRVIRITPVTSCGSRDCGALVTSTVTWRTGSLIAGQQVEVSTYLTNVYDSP
jgi:prepilin-type N-terminal cleavage/methylation domain-containing protein